MCLFKNAWVTRGPAILAFSLQLVSCGARTPLQPANEDVENAGGTGGGDASTSPPDAGPEAGHFPDAAADTAPLLDGAGGKPACSNDDPTTWEVEHYRDEGDYERAVAATSGVPWVAFKVRGGNIIVEQLGIDASGILVEEAFEIPDSPVYPIALDLNDNYFALLTSTGINWNGDLELWSVDRKDGTVLRTLVGQPPANPAYAANSALGLVGNDIALAYGRVIDEMGVLEIRDAALEVHTTLELEDAHFRAVRRHPLELDLYVGATSVLRIEPATIATEPVDPEWPLLGGLGEYLVQYADHIRMIRGDEVWLGPWPHTQISPPAVVREQGARAAFSLMTELTGVVGYPRNGSLEWLEIEPGPDASGIGTPLMPVLEDGRIGLFYLGLEIPHPEQPLRYFGRVCP